MVDPGTQREVLGDLTVREGRFFEGRSRATPGMEVVDGAGGLLCPGFIDVHVHFREPGGSEAETLASGAAAACRGGFTRVVTMPNTLPPVDTPEAVRAQSAGADAPRILPSACLTCNRAGREATALSALARAGAVAFTDDGSTVADDAVMEQAMRQAAGLNLPVLDHAIDPVLGRDGVIRDCPFARAARLPVLPAAAEVDAVRRDIALARRTGCRLHLQHLSTAGAVACVRDARREGLPVSAEATPHHLYFAAETIAEDNAVYKMNPPLGTRADIAALIEGLRDGTLTALATDHAPHPADRKALGFREAPFGVIGLETAAAVTYAVLVESAGFSLMDWVRLWTLGPADILGVSSPRLREGEPLDAVLFDVRSDWRVSPGDLASKSANCPFLGHRFSLRPRMTICEGRAVYRRC